MRFAAIADVHGNHLALEAVIADIRRQGITDIVNLGDMASGPLEARRSMDMLMELDAVHVLGNHDRYLIDRPPEKMGSWDRPAHAQPRGPGDLDNAGKSELRQSRLGRRYKRRADRFGDHTARAEQGIRRVGRQPGVACALHDHIGKTIEGFHRLRGHQLAAENEALCLPAGIADDVVADTIGDPKMELIDGAPQ